MSNEPNDSMAETPKDRDPLFSDDARRDDAASSELDAFQTLLSPLGSSDNTKTDFGQLLAQTALRAENARQNRRRLFRNTASLALAAVVLTAIILQFLGGGPGNSGIETPASDDDRLLFAPGTVWDGPGNYSLDGARLVLREGSRVRLNELDEGRPSLELLAGELVFQTTIESKIDTAAGQVRCENGALSVSSIPDERVAIVVQDGEAVFQSRDADLGDAETFLPASAQLTIHNLDEGGFRVGTPRLESTTELLANLCEKFDYGERDAKSEDFLIRKITGAAVTTEDTFVLWSLLARADVEEESRARGQLERRLIEIAGVPPNQKQMKSGTFDVASWLDHLRAGWQ